MMADPDRQYACNAYADPAGVPPVFWRKIEMLYPASDRLMTLVYDREPDDASELPALMWKLQRAAGPNGFSIRVTDADGAVTAAPAITPAGPKPA
jgi:hypothetical protein